MQETKHLTALEWLKVNGYNPLTMFSHEIEEAMERYHDYALDRAAEEVRLMVVVNNAERQLVCDNMTFALHCENKQIVVPDLNSLLNLKHNK